MPGPTTSDVMKKGFEVKYWQKYRDKKVKGSGVGEAIRGLRTFCGADGQIESKHLTNSSDYIDVKKAFDKLLGAIKTARKTAEKYKKQATIDYCDTFTIATLKRHKEAEKTCRQIMKNPGSNMDSKKMKEAKEIEKAIKLHLQFAKDTLSKAQAIAKKTAEQVAIVTTGVNKNPPTVQDLAKMRVAAETLEKIRTSWIGLAKHCDAVGTTWTMSKLPEHLKPKLAPMLNQIENKIYPKILMLVKAKVQKNAITNAYELCNKAEAKLLTSMVVDESKKAKILYKAIQNQDKQLQTALTTMDSSVHGGKLNDAAKLQLIDLGKTRFKKAQTETKAKYAVLNKLTTPEDWKKWSKDAVKHFDGIATGARDEILKTRKYLKDLDTRFGNALSMLDRWSQSLQKEGV